MGCAVVIVVWRGYGILAPVFPMLGALAGWGLGYVAIPARLAVCFGVIAGSAVTWWIGRRLNRAASRPQDQHSLWGIPMEFYAIPGVVLAVASLIEWIS